MANGNLGNRQNSDDCNGRERHEIAAEIKRACDYLEAEGLVLTNGIKLGTHRFVGIKYPEASLLAKTVSKETVELGRSRSIEIVEAPPKNPKSEEIIARMIVRAQRALKNAKVDFEPVRIGERVFISFHEKISAKDNPHRRR